jgi:hypothetical protein
MKNATKAMLSCMLLLVISCGKKDSDSTLGNDATNPKYDLVMGAFTVSPFDTEDIRAIIPLGNLNPTAHVFPSDHMYFICASTKPLLEIKSPGNVHILKISRTISTGGPVNKLTEYTIGLGSENSYMYWSHVSNLSQRLLAAVNNFAGATCEPAYSTGAITYEGCYVYPVSLSATAGETLGMANMSAGSGGMDMGVYLKNIGTNPLQYFDASSRAMLEAKLGSNDGKIKRTVEPVCGEFNYDIAGAAIGNWIKTGFPRTPEDNNIALVKDNITPSIQVFSAGNTLPGLSKGTYYFIPKQTGIINRNFAEVTADGNTYCYTMDLLGFVNTGNSIPNSSIIIKLENSSTLSVEKRNCDCTCTPYVFTANKVTYTR